MIGPAIENLGMKIGSCMVDESVEEIVQELGLEIADEPNFYFVFINKRGAAAEIDRNYG